MGGIKTTMFINFSRSRKFMVSWISLVLLIFYNTFEFYRNGRQFLYLRNMLGLGLCVSRGTATVLNLSCGLVLLPLCKKLNQMFYPLLSKFWPKLFFFWLENAKSFHMTVGATIIIFSMIHSSSHFLNLWNFSREYNEEVEDINFAHYKDESLLYLLFTLPVVTGIFMILIIMVMGATSLRVVRIKYYNTFWYTHKLYLMFLALLLLHPLSGVLKEEILINGEEIVTSQVEFNVINVTNAPIFQSIESQTWKWMLFPLICFLIDLLWRLISRNNSRVIVKGVEYFPGQTMNLTLVLENKPFRCREGQYILLQCPGISLLEWHPFTVAKVPTTSQDEFNVWIRVKGDWTEQLKQTITESSTDLLLLLDGPYTSPMEEVNKSQIAICVAAGVGITPFVPILQSLFKNPGNRYPGRIHLIWIVKYEHELTWIAKLANNTILKLSESNMPDRLNIQLYVTNNSKPNSFNVNNEHKLANDHIVIFNERYGVRNVLNEKDEDVETKTLLTPNMRRNVTKNTNILKINDTKSVDLLYKISKEYPILGCRLKNGRPRWDNLFDYWIHMYPGYRLKLFCCGPKELSILLRKKCNQMNQNTKTSFTFINEGFS